MMTQIKIEALLSDIHIDADDEPDVCPWCEEPVEDDDASDVCARHGERYHSECHYAAEHRGC